MTEFTCPYFGDVVCESAIECERINAPLTGSLFRIREETGVNRIGIAKTALDRQIFMESRAIGVDLHFGFKGDGAKICPVEVLEGDLGKRLGIIVAREALNAIMERSVNHAIEDIVSKNRVTDI